MDKLESHRVENLLNSAIQNIRSGQTEILVHYWGMDNAHFSNMIHKHSFFEVCYVIHGVGIYVENGIEFPLDSGSLFVSRPGCTHQIKSDTGLVITFVAFEVSSEGTSDSWQNRIHAMSKLENVVVNHAQRTVTSKIWETLLHAVTSSSFDKDTLNALATALIISFPTSFEPVEPIPPIQFLKNKNPLLERAMIFIRDNLARPLSMEDVSSYLNVSGRHLSRLFSETTGMSYHAFLQHERIIFARELLSETEYPIKSIAERTGFSSVHYFTRVFTKLSNETPARYRKLYRSKLLTPSDGAVVE